MSDTSEFFAAFERECTRLGLNWRDLPGLAIDGGVHGESAFLARLRAMPRGVTWHTVFPSLPTHWIPGRPDTWTAPFRPLGPYDHQAPPAGPAVMIGWDRGTDRACLATLVSAARLAGFPIYGADFHEPDGPDASTLDAIIVFDRGVTSDVVFDFHSWLEQRKDAVMLSMFRNGDEKYAPQ